VQVVLEREVATTMTIRITYFLCYPNVDEKLDKREPNLYKSKLGCGIITVTYYK